MLFPRVSLLISITLAFSATVALPTTKSPLVFASTSRGTASDGIKSRSIVSGSPGLVDGECFDSCKRDEIKRLIEEGDGQTAPGLLDASASETCFEICRLDNGDNGDDGDDGDDDGDDGDD